MDTSVALVTVSVVLALRAPDAAVAVAVLLEDQATVAEMSCFVPSLKEPVAVNAWLVPAAMVGVSGEIAMELRAAGVTVRDALPTTAPRVAEMVALPTPVPLATPVLAMVATAVLVEAQ